MNTNFRLLFNKTSCRYYYNSSTSITPQISISSDRAEQKAPSSIAVPKLFSFLFRLNSSSSSSSRSSSSSSLLRFIRNDHAICECASLGETAKPSAKMRHQEIAENRLFLSNSSKFYLTFCPRRNTFRRGL